MDTLIQRIIHAARKLQSELHTINFHLASLRSDVQQQTNAIRESAKANDERDWAQPLVQTELRTPIPIRVQAETNERNSAWKSVKTGFEILGIAAVITYTWVSYRTWKELIATTDSTFRQLKIGRRAVAVAEHQAAIAAASFHADQRAWININYNAGPSGVGASTAFEEYVSFVNTGKTPASRIGGVVTLKYRAMTEAPDFDYLPKKSKTVRGHTFRAGLLRPNAPPQAIYTNSIEITPEMAQRFNEGKSYIALYGYIDYFDIFGHEHWLHFCSARAVVTAVQAFGGENEQNSSGRKGCTDYNAVDPDPE